MLRKCDGTDPNLRAEDGKSPCACGKEFDDVDTVTIYPHPHIPTREERDKAVSNAMRALGWAPFGSHPGPVKLEFTSRNRDGIPDWERPISGD